MKKIKIINNSTIDFRKKPNEDIDLIDAIENLFIKKRRYVVKIPDAGTPVLVCMSGGMDSTAIIAILLNEFKFKVYPFFINRNQSNYYYEKKSVLYYNNLFKKRFPRFYSEVFEIKIETPSGSYKSMLTDDLKNNHMGYPARNSVIFMTGAEYAYSLRSIGIKINTIFGAAVVSDSLFHSSLTWVRVTNLSICQFFNDYNWQLISLPIEKELKNSYDKDVLIKYCKLNNIPLEYTRTCTEASKIQCGKCICCYDRRRCYRKAKIRDRTKYLFPYRKPQK